VFRDGGSKPEAGSTGAVEPAVEESVVGGLEHPCRMVEVVVDPGVEAQ
jgi:hypothetical protein